MYVKISDTCQLINPVIRTFTSSGLTITSYGDGRFNINGTCIGGAYIDLSSKLKPYIIGHKYLWSFVQSKRYIYVATCGPYSEPSSSIIYEPTINDYYYIRIRKVDGGVFDNYDAYVNLFDLTEMYGAGNEPTTIEQFKADYPDDYYPYSPKCWVKYYKTNLITPTRNLWERTTLKNRLLANGGYDTNDKLCSITNDGKYFKFGGNYGDSNGSNPYVKLKAGHTYTFSFKKYLFDKFYSLTNKDGAMMIRAFTNNIDSWLVNNGIHYCNPSDRVDIINLCIHDMSQIIPPVTFTVPEGYEYIVCSVHCRNTSTMGFYDIQLEEGSTATSYVPYDYLPMHKMKLISPRLPREYQEVEYIQADYQFRNPSYIDTGVVPNDNMTFIGEFGTDYDSAFYARLFGTDVGDAGFRINNSTYNSIDCTYRTQYTRQYGWNLLPQYNTVKLSKKKLYLNDVLKYTFSQSISTTKTVTLMWCGTDVSVKVRTKYFMIYDENDLLVRHFIPCYRISDNKSGMYDLCGSICPITGTSFYVNKGIGADFTVGNDVDIMFR